MGVVGVSLLLAFAAGVIWPHVRQLYLELLLSLYTALRTLLGLPPAPEPEPEPAVLEPAVDAPAPKTSPKPPVVVRRAPPAPSPAPLYAACGTLASHDGWVTALAFLPDGRLVSGSADATVRVWPAPLAACEPGAEFVLEGHVGAVRSLVPLQAPVFASPADVCFASAGDDSTVRIWACSPGAAWRCLAVLAGHGDAVYALVALPDGALLSAAADHALRLWRPQPEGYRCGAALAGHSDFVLALALCAAPLAAVSAGWDATLRVWEGLGRGGDPACARVLRGHVGPVRAVAPLPCGARVVSGGADGGVRIWRPATGVCERILVPPGAAPATPAPILALQSVGADTLAVAAEDGSLCVWAIDGSNAQLAAALSGHGKRVYALAAGGMPDALCLASGSRDRTVRLWRLST